MGVRRGAATSSTLARGDDSTRSRAARRLRLFGVLVAALAVLAAPSALARSAAQLRVSVGGTLRSVPRSFLGISVETSELPSYEHYLNSFARLLDVLRPPGESAPVVLRVGGESADSSFWGSNPWAVVGAPYRQSRYIDLTPAWMAQLGALVRAAGLKVILDLNLAAHSPQMAAEVALAARKALPSRSIQDFEVGNEPDLYQHGLVGFTRAEPDGPNAWAFSFVPADYVTWFGAYVKAIRAVIPNAEFAGPSVISRAPQWVRELVGSSQARNVSLVTAHNYPPFEGCASPGDPHYPIPAGYLKDSNARGVARSERFVVKASSAHGIPVRLTEVGSSVCGGIEGQTDTFATALWAPDLFFHLVLQGVEGVNIHLRAGYLNTALGYQASQIYAEPLFYGMATFARTLGPGARIMRVSRHGGLSELKVWAIRTGKRLNVLYINKSSRPAYVKLATTSTGSGRLERLDAPSIYANSTVTLAGQRLGPGGHWLGHRDARPVPEHGGFYRVLVPAFSAALLSVPGR
jgi:hypothetical protein